MFLTRLKARAVVLLASCAMASLTALATGRAQADPDDGRPAAALAAVASGDPASPAARAAAKAEKPPAAGRDGAVRSKGRLLTPAGKRIYVNVFSTDSGHNQDFLFNYALVNVVPEISRVRGVGSATMLGDRGFAIMRIRLNPDRMRANNLSPEDIMKAFEGCSMLGSSGRPARSTEKTSDENVLTHRGGRYSKPEMYENIILKATPEGEILRLKDVAAVESGTQNFNFDANVDGHPSAAIVLKQAPGFSAGGVIEAIRQKLAEIKQAAFPPGMGFDVIPLDSPGMIYAVIEPPRDATLEFTSAKCHELAAIAKGVGEIASVWSLAGYDARTEGRDSRAGTCLIQLQDRSDRKLTSRQIIEALEEKCRPMNVHLEFFESPAVSVFVAAGGFSVRVLDRTNSNKTGSNKSNSSDKRLAGAPESSMDDLLNRQDLEGLFTFLASNYPRHELIINSDVARQKGVSIASALVNLPLVVGVDEQGKRKFWRAAEDLQSLRVKNDRGEMVPYSSFIELKEKPGLNEIGR